MSHHDDWEDDWFEEPDDEWRILGNAAVVLVVLLMAGLVGGPLAVLFVLLALVLLATVL